MRKLVALMILAIGIVSVSNKGWPQSQPAQDAQSANAVFKAAETVSSAIISLRDGQKSAPACLQGQDNRESDLCAQWKAADAAQEAAQYALWTMFLGLASTAMLVFTFWETRKVSHAQLRPYLSFSTFDIIIVNRVDIGKFEIFVETKLRNSGATPAFECVHCGNILAFSHEEAKAYFSKSNKAPRIGNPTPYAVHTGLDMNARFNAHTEFENDNLQEIESRLRSLYAFGEVIYHDKFGKKHFTQFCLTLRSELTWKNNQNDSNKTIVWETAPFHNNSS